MTFYFASVALFDDTLLSDDLIPLPGKQYPDRCQKVRKPVQGGRPFNATPREDLGSSPRLLQFVGRGQGRSLNQIVGEH